MNQIPNIEETHNTREWEDEFNEKMFNYIKIIEVGQYNENGVNIGFLPATQVIKDFIHQELQKAREEMRQETMRKVMSKLRNQFNSENDELSLEEIEVALYELDHSELDQEVSK